ncbi:MAG: GNAT family N-acetyltransferase [Actinomycetota bacterium]|nr:GNAT family N-acetyltransferase [Actinomycetota bacterium]
MLTVRPATMRDSDQLLLWRNESAARRWSPNPAEISPAEHSLWLTAVLVSDRHLVLVAEAGGQPIGSVRFAQHYAGVWEVSVVLDPAQRGRGLGRASLTAAEDLLLARAVGTMTIQAVIHRDNDRSLQLFRGAGYRPVPTALGTGEFVTYAKDLAQE